MQILKREVGPWAWLISVCKPYRGADLLQPQLSTDMLMKLITAAIIVSRQYTTKYHMHISYSRSGTRISLLSNTRVTLTSASLHCSTPHLEMCCLRVWALQWSGVTSSASLTRSRSLLLYSVHKYLFLSQHPKQFFPRARGGPSDISTHTSKLGYMNSSRCLRKKLTKLMTRTAVNHGY